MNFTNEGGVDGTTRFLKNITGMWLLEECRRIWAKEGRTYTYAEIMAMAAAAEPGRTRIDPDDEAFAHPADMPAAIRDWCRGRGKVPPADDAALVRCIFESLAARYGPRSTSSTARPVRPAPAQTTRRSGSRTLRRTWRYALVTCISGGAVSRRVSW